MRRSRRPGKGQEFFSIEGIPEPEKPKRRPRVYVYTEPDGDSFLLRTPDFEMVRDLLQELGIHSHWLGIKRGLVIRAKHLPDLVAACQAHRWYVRVQELEAGVA